MNSTPPGGFWDRAVILVDMNAFFAGIEQLDNPDLRGRPLAVTNGLRGTCAITCSYEARAFGVCTGMRLKEARRLCPELIQCPARPERYARVSTAIMTALEEFTPEVEVFSVDEAFLDITASQRVLGAPEAIARRVRQTAFQASGVTCSVGLSGDKTTAKWAAKQQKPDGLTIIEPWRAAEALRDVPVTELCGIADGIGRYLAARGVHTCGDMAGLPISELSRRWGSIGRRIWLMAQGRDPLPVRRDEAPPKSIGHGKVMPPETSDRKTLHIYLDHMAEKVAARLRRHDMVASRFFIGLRTRDDWCAVRYHVAPTDDGAVIRRLGRELLDKVWRGQGIWQVQITAGDPEPYSGQGELFGPAADPSRRCNQAMDAINRRFGEFTLAPASLLGRSDMPNVISPAWRPYGCRETIGGRYQPLFEHGNKRPTGRVRPDGGWV